MAGCTGDGDDGNGSTPTDTEAPNGNGEDTPTAEATPTEADELDFPTGPIEIIIPFGAGGGTDTITRTYAPAMSEALGVDVSINNLPGAEQMRALGEAQRADPDGHTLIAFNPPSTPIAYLTVQPDEINLENFTGIGYYTTSKIIVATSPDNEVDGYSDLIERYESGEFSTIGGSGTPWQIAADILKENHGLDWNQWVDYSDSSEAIRDVSTGDIDAYVGTDGATEPFHSDGTVEIITVVYSEGSEVVPDVPSVTDAGYENVDYYSGTNRGLFAPPETPLDVRQRLYEALETACNSEAMQNWYEESGSPQVMSGPEEVDAHLSDMFETLPEVVDLEEYRD